MKLILWFSIISIAQQAQAGFSPVPNSLIEAEDLRQIDSPALIDASQSGRASTRAAAATAYGRIQKPGGINPLLNLLQDSNETVQQAAIFSLGQFGWDAAFADGRESEIIGQLEPFLKDSNHKLRAAAVEAIGKLALELTPAKITASLRDDSESVKAEAVTALYRYRLLLQSKKPNSPIADLPEETLNQVLALAKDSSARVRQSVAFYFSTVKSPDALAAVIGLSSDSELWVRYFATEALGRIASQIAVAPVIQLTQDAESVVRIAAIQAVARLQSVQTLSDSLQDALQADPVAHVRSSLATALGTWTGTAPIPESRLMSLLQDSSAEVRMAALQSLSLLKKDLATGAVQSALADSNWVIREGAVEAASNLDSSKEKLLLQGAQDVDVRVRFPAVGELADVATDAAFKAMSDALASNQFSERYTAVDAIATRKENAQSPTLIWQTYQQSLADNPLKWTGVREEAIAQLAPFPGDLITQELRQAAKTDPAPSVVKFAIQALRARGETDLPSPMEEILTFSPYRKLRFKQNPRVVLETTRGQIVIECYPESAPIHVANFVGFARVGGYDGLPWHRVVPNFVVQGGDPDRTGFGDAGYSLRAEINSLRYRRGSVGMPRSDDFGSGGVQLFITHVPTPNLDGRYTIFGQVTAGMEIVDALEVGDLILHAHVEE